MLRLHDPIIYVDPHGVARAAILSTIWGAADQATDPNHPALVHCTKDAHGNVIATDDEAPTVNLMFTSGDPDRRDNAGYGRQMERASSVVHMNRQSAFGSYWRRYIETGKPTEQQP